MSALLNENESSSWLDRDIGWYMTTISQDMNTTPPHENVKGNRYIHIAQRNRSTANTSVSGIQIHNLIILETWNYLAIQDCAHVLITSFYWAWNIWILNLLLETYLYTRFIHEKKYIYFSRTFILSILIAKFTYNWNLTPQSESVYKLRASQHLGNAPCVHSPFCRLCTFDVMNTPGPPF